MQQIADFHIHSRYSRACSRDLTLGNIDKACRTKGIDIIGTGDFTFPEWFKSINEDLEELMLTTQDHVGAGLAPAQKQVPSAGTIGHPQGAPLRRGTGLYKLKSADDNKVKFILTTEFALIYKKYDKCRRIHIVLHAPNIEAVRKLNNYLDKKYNIRSDGRPILGMSAEELMKLCFSIHPQFLIYPAHIWTPWFSVFGSKSGFDHFEECFGEYTKDVYAYETGLSSDPEMNWRVSELDKYALLSNSDAHSLPNLAREANVFELDENEISYDGISKAIKDKKAGRLKYTIEFYPEEGMYHYDGHRDCGVRLSPVETKRNKGICPVCKKPLTIGVMYRANELADRPLGFKPDNVPGYKKLVELDKIIAESFHIKSRQAQKVKIEYDKLIRHFGNEINILMNVKIDDIEEAAGRMIAEGVKRVREGDLKVLPGYDGQYGEVKIYSETEKQTKLL